jgi:peptide/nickel transport system substrate-binding protein
MLQRRQLLSAGAALAGAGLSRRAFGASTSSIIRFVPQADLSSIDPVWTTATVAFNHAMLVYDTLYGIDLAQQPQPQMVAGHEISDDKLTWTFTLRDGLFFHDGEKVRALDCTASIARWAKRKGFGQKLASLTAEMKPLDDKRFRIQLTKPFPLMTYALGAADICFIMPQRSAEVDPFKQITDATGSGPFRFLDKERVSGAFVAYEKFDKYVPRQEKPSYWSGGKVANVDRVEWRVTPDPSTAASALQRNEVDWIEQPLFDLLPMMRKQAGIQLVAIDPLGAPGVMALNHTQPPFDNEKLRQALLPAIDQNEFMTALVGDQTQSMKTPVGIFTLDTPAASTVDLQVFSGKRDVALAKRLVAESGYKGEKVVLMAPSDQAVLIPLAQVAQSVLQEIGLNVDYQVMDWGTLISRRASDKPASEGGWNMFCTSWNGITLSNPGSHFPLRGNGKSGWFGWPTSPVLEGLRDDWFAAPDAAAQKAICDKMQAVAFKEVPFIPLGEYYLPSALRTSITDVVHCGNTSFWGARKTA